GALGGHLPANGYRTVSEIKALPLDIPGDVRAGGLGSPHTPIDVEIAAHGRSHGSGDGQQAVSDRHLLRDITFRFVLRVFPVPGDHRPGWSQGGIGEVIKEDDVGRSRGGGVGTGHVAVVDGDGQAGGAEGSRLAAGSDGVGAIGDAGETVIPGSIGGGGGTGSTSQGHDGACPTGSRGDGTRDGVSGGSSGGGKIHARHADATNGNGLAGGVKAVARVAWGDRIAAIGQTRKAVIPGTIRSCACTRGSAQPHTRSTASCSRCQRSRNSESLT